MAPEITEVILPASIWFEVKIDMEAVIHANNGAIPAEIGRNKFFGDWKICFDHCV